MRRLLQSKRVRLIMFEYLQGTNLREALAAFESAGYTTFELTSHGPTEVRDSARPLQNLFACPTEMFSAL